MDDLREAIDQVLAAGKSKPKAGRDPVNVPMVRNWLEAIEPGRPLSFLDHQIQCGNSLLGTTPALLANGVPDDAFEAIEGDDRKIASALRKRNKAERKATGQKTMFADFVRDAEAEDVSLADQAARLRSLADDTITALHQKEGAYASLAASAAYARKRLLADAWCAAFVWRKEKAVPDAPTIATRSPGATSRSTPSSTGTGSRP